MATTADRAQRRLRVALVAGFVLFGAGCDEEAPPPSDGALARCGPMRQVVERFGPTLASPFDNVALARYRFVVDEGDREDELFGRTETLSVVSPDDTACQQEVAERLESTCRRCNGMTEANCLLEVEAAMRAPSPSCTYCGDRRCVGAETPETCPDDCRCGDGSCDALFGETSSSCPDDCGTACGNGVCEGTEACTCDPADAGCQVCGRDCCDAICGDGLCELDRGESLANCEQDCAVGTCGDGRCLAGESPTSCPQDCPVHSCASCPACFPGTCGDGVCEGCEPMTCTTDCADAPITYCGAAFGAMSCPGRYCGDGVCDGIEDFTLCPSDCVFGAFGLPCGAEAEPDCVSRGCGDGYCQAEERALPRGVPWENDPLDVCASDCGGLQCDRVDLLAACGDPSLPARRCEFLRVQFGENPDGSDTWAHAIVDCTRPCPVVEVCQQACDDASGEPSCIACPTWTRTDLAGCQAGTSVCVGAQESAACMSEPGFPAACNRPVNAAFCDVGCDGSTGECIEP